MNHIDTCCSVLVGDLPKRLPQLFLELGALQLPILTDQTRPVRVLAMKQDQGQSRIAVRLHASRRARAFRHLRRGEPWLMVLFSQVIRAESVFCSSLLEEGGLLSKARHRIKPPSSMRFLFPSARNCAASSEPPTAVYYR